MYEYISIWLADSYLLSHNLAVGVLAACWLLAGKADLLSDLHVPG